jgi:cytochrome c peroxidase
MRFGKRVVNRRLIAVAMVWLALAVEPGVGGGQASARAAEPFTRDVLLMRFDRNRNGRLDDEEKRALRDAFGGLDVPMLPAKTHDYTAVTLPATVRRSRLDELDNTLPDNRLTDHGATLGRVLFYDRQLSRNHTVACASCHPQKTAFADPQRFSLGFAGGRTSRNAMALANLRYTKVKGERPGLFWDERAATLEAQVLIPIQDKLEMGMELKELEDKLQKLPYYPPLFKAAFGEPTVTSERVAQAVAQFLRSMVSFNSKFDRAAAGAVKTADLSAEFSGFTPQENLGKSLFINGVDGVAEFACAMCHVPPTFNMALAANNGLELKYKDPGLGALARPSNDPFTPSNDGKFKAPSLRNIELTAPYMHDGRFKTLDEVVEHYSSGVHPHPNLGLALPEGNEEKKGTKGLRLSKEQKAALVAFLKTLTDREFVSDSKFSDPFIRVRD